MSINNPDISVIVATYNRPKLAERTLTYLLNQNFRSHEIIVVDQSDVGAVDVNNLHDPGKRIRCFQRAERGLPAARNFAIEQARAPIVLFCDDDVIPSMNLLSAHLQHYQDANIGGVAGRVADRRRKRAHKITGKLNRFNGNQYDSFDSDLSSEVDHGQGCNISFRRDILNKNGGFDVHYGGSAFLEDTDICLRVRHAGYKIIFEPTATVVHLKKNTGGCRSENHLEWYYWYGHNYTRFFLKHFNRRYFPFFLFSRFLNIAKGCFIYRDGRVALYGIRGILAGKRNLTAVIK